MDEMEDLDPLWDNEEIMTCVSKFVAGHLWDKENDFDKQILGIVIPVKDGVKSFIVEFSYKVVSDLCANIHVTLLEEVTIDELLDMYIDRKNDGNFNYYNSGSEI